jgi:hypothetical protein
LRALPAISRLNPARFLLGPSLLAALLLVVAAAGRIPALFVPSGAIIFILGARIAYDHRNAGSAYMRVKWRCGQRSRTFARLYAPATERMIDGSVIGALGLALGGMGLIWSLR